MKTEKLEEDILIDALEIIRPDREEFINRRINHINFARIIFWLCVKSRKEEFFYANELSKFIKLSLGRTHHILNEFVNAELLKKKFPTDNLSEFWFARNDKGRIYVSEYFDKARKTLKLKSEITFEKEER